MIWNFPDHEVEWVPKLYRATRDREPPWASPVRQLDTGLFSEADERWVRWTHELPGPDGLRNLVHTWSWVITRSDRERAAIDNRLRILIARYAELQGATIGFPNRTKVVCHRLR